MLKKLNKNIRFKLKIFRRVEYSLLQLYSFVSRAGRAFFFLCMKWKFWSHAFSVFSVVGEVLLDGHVSVNEIGVLVQKKLYFPVKTKMILTNC
jgi:hypothetical protein